MFFFKKIFNKNLWSVIVCYKAGQVFGRMIDGASDPLEDLSLKPSSSYV